jgi:hypothetical protein
MRLNPRSRSRLARLVSEWVRNLSELQMVLMRLAYRSNVWGIPGSFSVE